MYVSFVMNGMQPSRDKVLDAMSGHILDEAELVATYGKENYVTGRDTYIPRDAPHGVGPGHPEVKGGNPMGQLHRWRALETFYFIAQMQKLIC